MRSPGGIVKGRRIGGRVVEPQGSPPSGFILRTGDGETLPAKWRSARDVPYPRRSSRRRRHTDLEPRDSAYLGSCAQPPAGTALRSG